MRTGLDSQRLHAIIDTQNEIAATALDLDAVMALVVERARQLTSSAAAVVELAEGDEMVYHVGSGTATPYVGLRLAIDSSLSGLCVRQGITLHCVDATVDDRVDAQACQAVGAISMVCIPLAHEGRTVGVLKVYDPRRAVFTDDDVATLDLLSGVIAAHMSHATDFEAQRHDIRHDALTGLPNRRAFDERLAGELARTRRHGGRLVVCLLDLDRFKQVNDTEGHAAGDAVLKAVGAHLAALRGEDTAYRIGGDEFALLLVEATVPGAEVVAERIAAAVAGDSGCHGVGASWGLADLRSDDDAASLLARADAALYTAKDSRPPASVRAADA